jgi:hypothetical protein
MTRQTSEPLEHLSIQPTGRRTQELSRTYREDYRILLDTPYQRGSVWTEDQRISLIFSLMKGIFTGTIIFNDRSNPDWVRKYGHPHDKDEHLLAVIDGRQRLETIFAWYDGELAVPSTWFPADEVETTVDTDDGPYVTHLGLTRVGKARFNSNAMQAISEQQLPTLEKEAEIFLLVNGGGTPQTDADMAKAARVAGK